MDGGQGECLGVWVKKFRVCGYSFLWIWKSQVKIYAKFPCFTLLIRVLRLLYKDYTSTYDSLLAKANKPSMEPKCYRALALDIFKALKVLNPTYIQDLFYLSSSSARRSINIAVVRTNTNTYGKKTLESLGPQIWNSLLEHIKAENSFAHFRSLINTWFGKEFLCNLCRHIRTLNSTNY